MIKFRKLLTNNGKAKEKDQAGWKNSSNANKRSPKLRKQRVPEDRKLIIQNELEPRVEGVVDLDASILAGANDASQ